MRICGMLTKTIKSTSCNKDAVMSRFEILCVTMNQQGFQKIHEMNIHSNIVYANQTNTNSYEEIDNEGYYAKMISTTTKGVGINRNLALMYADADYCLLSDDDMIYYDNLEDIVVNEFRNLPDADIIIFNIDSLGEERKQRKINRTRKCYAWDRMSWGAVRVAVHLDSIKKKNIWFSPLFGGGCLYPSGEDSIFLTDAQRKGLKIYLSSKVIGKTDFNNSSWFSGYDENYYYGKGAFYQALHKKPFLLWAIYICLRTRKGTELKFIDRIHCLIKGKKSFQVFGSRG